MRKIFIVVICLVNFSSFATVVFPSMMDPNTSMLLQMQLLNQRGVMPPNYNGGIASPIGIYPGQITPPPQMCAMNGGSSCMAPINQDPRFQSPGVYNPIGVQPAPPAAYSPIAPASPVNFPMGTMAR